MSAVSQTPIYQRAMELADQVLESYVIPLYYRTDKANSEERGKPLPYLKIATTLVREYGLKTIVEIGSMRGPMDHGFDELDKCCIEGHSTLFFADTGAEVYTVDVNSYCAQVLVAATRKYRNLHVYTADGIWFLKRFDRPIDFLYLDAWDVIAGTNYSEKHLEAYRAALPHLAPRSAILIDDTDLLNGGKGRHAIPQMIRDGFDLVTWGRQALLVRS
jgi:hypothetical protein